MKICSSCLENKEFVMFSKRSLSKDGYSPVCKNCASEYLREWREKNPDRVAHLSKKWREKNPQKNKEIKTRYRKNNLEKARAATRKSMAKNPAKYKELRKNWGLKNPEKTQNKNYLRRARLLNAGVFLVTAKDIQKLRSKSCVYCGGASEHIDHVVPLSRGGRHSIGNLVPSCAKCNMAKSNKFLVEWKVGV